MANPGFISTTSFGHPACQQWSMSTDQGVCPKHHWVWYQNAKPNQNSIGSFLVHHSYTAKSFEYFVYMSTLRFLLRVYCLEHIYLSFPLFCQLDSQGHLFSWRISGDDLGTSTLWTRTSWMILSSSSWAYSLPSPGPPFHKLGMESITNLGNNIVMVVQAGRGERRIKRKRRLTREPWLRAILGTSQL